jgi:NADH-quinone oxidoreductase subunit L
MAIALIALAIGSVLAGYVSLGGRFEHFLEPSFGLEAAHEASDSSVGLTLMIVSSVVAFAGIGIAAYFFLKNRQAAAMMAERFAGVRRLLVNKFYIDEIYDATVVQPIRIISEDGLWKTLTSVIDAAVNGIGDTVGGMSEMLRRLQSGSVRTYAASLFAGVVFILGYYLWR